MLPTTILLTLLTTLVAADASDLGRACGGAKQAKCPTDMKCSSRQCVWRNSYPSCGGFRVAPAPTCPSGSTCQDDPREPDSCGMACDKPGICVPNNAPKCGGFAGFVCPTSPKALYCYDIMTDSCDPRSGGRDCLGVCL